MYQFKKREINSPSFFLNHLYCTMETIKYYFGKDFIHNHEKAWRHILQVHPKEDRTQPSIDFLCKFYKACELSAKLYYKYIDDNVFQGEMEKLFPDNKIIDAYNKWANGLITTDEYIAFVKKHSSES